MPMYGRMGRPGLLGLAARTAVVAGTATAVSGGMRRRAQSKEEAQQEQQQAAAQQQQDQINAAAAAAVAAQQPAAAAPAGGTDIIAELQKLAALKDQGILTDAEFGAAKAKLLA